MSDNIYNDLTDPHNSASVYQAFLKTDAEIIDSRIANSYIVDYGKVIKVNDNKTVNVQHIVRTVLLNGTVLPPNISVGVEVLFPQSASFGMSWTIAVDDPVLLLGFRDYVPNTATAKCAIDNEEPEIFSHYKKDNLKAVPMCGIGNANTVVINEKDGKLIIKNGDASLLTLIESLIAEIKVLKSVATAVTIGTGLVSATGGPVTGTLTTVAGLDISSANITNLNTIKTNFEKLLEA